jgi:hypothetical protein
MTSGGQAQDGLPAPQSHGFGLVSFCIALSSYLIMIFITDGECPQFAGILPIDQ